MKQIKRLHERWIWTELISFDNHHDDFNVTKYLEKAICMIVWALVGYCAIASAQQANEAELNALLEKINPNLVEPIETRLRAKLDAAAAQQFHGLLPAGELTPGRPYVKTLPDGSRRLIMKYGTQAGQAGGFLVAYEILGEKKYLDVALQTCDFLLRAQQPKGFWLPEYHVSPTGVVKPHTSDRPARQGYCRIQDGYQDEAFFLLIYAWRLTGQQKYFDAAKRCADCLLEIQNENGSWPDYWDFAIPREKGPVTGAEGVRLGCSYNDGATTRPATVMITMYHITKDKKYIARLGGIGQWIFDTQLGQGKVRGWCQQYGLDNKPIQARNFEMPVIEPRTFNRFVFPLSLWFYLISGEERYIKLIQETYDWLKSVEHPEGWAYSYLPDGTEVFSVGYKIYRYDQPGTWPQGKNPYPYSREKVHLDAVPPILEIYHKGGHEALRRHFRGPVKYSPEQYLQARIAAAREVTRLDTMEALQKNITSRNATLQYLFNVRLAQGKIDPQTAAPGGYGVLSLTPGMNWRNRVYKVEDWFDLPLRK